MPEFTFDRAVQRYRNSKGQFISETKMLELTQRTIEQTQKDVNTIADLFVSQKISLSTWESQTAVALKQMHIQSYMLGRGGQKMMSQRDYGIVGDKLKQEYRYLDQFAQDIKAGMSEAQFRARLRMYLNNARSSYQLAKREGHEKAGFKWERRKLAVAENCDPCINYAELGWQPIKTLPGIGDRCDCRANCKCRFEFSKDKPSDFMLSAGFGWLKPARFSAFLHG